MGSLSPRSEFESFLRGSYRLACQAVVERVDGEIHFKPLRRQPKILTLGQNKSHLDFDPIVTRQGPDVLYDGKPGNYTLSVFVNRDQSLATGREVWSMPKKLGEVHLMGNGRQSCVTAQRKGAEMRLHTLLKAPVFSSEPEQTKATFYEIKAGMKATDAYEKYGVL